MRKDVATNRYASVGEDPLYRITYRTDVAEAYQNRSDE